jgi:hypothetical protein
VDVVGEEEVTPAEKGFSDDNDSGGVFTNNEVLRLGELDEHLGSELEDLQLVEHGGSVVGGDNVTKSGGNLLVDATRTQAGAHSILHLHTANMLAYLMSFLCLLSTYDSVFKVEA